MKIPVTILTGFLGAGKTTILNQILRTQENRRIAIIENEFGAVNVDHHLIENLTEEIVELQNGCICCQIRGDFVQALESLSQRSNKFDYIIVETTGMADPKPLIETFFADSKVRFKAELDSVIAVVDAENVLSNWERVRELQRQVAHADTIFINKCDLVSEESLSVIQLKLETANPMAKIYRRTRLDEILPDLLNTKSFQQPLKISLGKSASFVRPETHSHTSVVSEVIDLPVSLKRRQFEGVVSALLSVWSDSIFRMKGILKFQGSDDLFSLHAVHQRFEITRLPRLKESVDCNRLVVIARDDSYRGFLHNGIEACSKPSAPPSYGLRL